MSLPGLPRRDFLKLSGAVLGGLLWRGTGFAFAKDSSAKTLLDLLPAAGLARQTVQLAPQITLDSAGILQSLPQDGKAARPLPHFRTLWNQEFCRPQDRLDESLTWGIVLHWYGDRDGAYQSIQDYLHGFDSYRLINPAAPQLNPKPPQDVSQGNIRNLDRSATLPSARRYRTSAHFLIGSACSAGLASPASLANQDETTDSLQDAPSIVQTQTPDTDGNPFIAAHIGPMNYVEPTYFLDALHKLEKHAQSAGSALGYRLPQDFALADLYAHPGVPANWRTIGIEITGYDFDTPQGLPQAQQIANLLAVVCALMKRYRISAHNILGHHELQMGKADPGKKFLALIQFLVGVKALVDQDSELQKLVFAPFSSVNAVTPGAVRGYFQTLRSYLSLISSPLVVYEWEKLTHYWLVVPALAAGENQAELASQWQAPLPGKLLAAGKTYLSPETHEGLDVYPQLLYDRRASGGSSAAVHLMAAGECLFCGEENLQHGGGLVVMRHTLPEGARILSIYGNLQQVYELQPGVIYPAGYPLGKIEKKSAANSPFLHLALACEAVWQDGFAGKPGLPLNAGLNWIRQRYLDPLPFLQERGIF